VSTGIFLCIRLGLKDHPGIGPLLFMTAAGFLIVADKSLVRALIAAGTTLLVFGSLVIHSAYQHGKWLVTHKADTQEGAL